MLFLLSSAMALTVQAPREVVLDQSHATFPIVLTNETNEDQPLFIEFLGPNQTNFNAPSLLPRNSSISIIVTAQNPAFLHNFVYESQLKVNAGNQTHTSRIRWVFLAPETDQNTPVDQNTDDPFTGLFGFANWDSISSALTSGAVQGGIGFAFAIPLILVALVLLVLLQSLGLIWGIVSPLIYWMAQTLLISSPIAISILQALLIVLVLIVGIAFLARLKNRLQENQPVNA